MRSSGGLILFILFTLAVWCCSGESLQCYNCNKLLCNESTTCLPNRDACILAMHGSQIFRGCWRFLDCDFEFISTRLGFPQLRYKCCQEDLCNDRLDGAGSLSGKTVLLVISLLAAAWSLYY